MAAPAGPDDTKAKAVPKGKAIGGMPYGLPMALLQMEAEPGSLTGLSHQTLDSDIAPRIPLAASTLQVGCHLNPACTCSSNQSQNVYLNSETSSLHWKSN